MCAVPYFFGEEISNIGSSFHVGDFDSRLLNLSHRVFALLHVADLIGRHVVAPMSTVLLLL